jgi:ATP-dependent DNA helicase RecG
LADWQIGLVTGNCLSDFVLSVPCVDQDKTKIMVRMSANTVITAIDTKEVKFVTIKNLIGTTESEILEWKSSFSQLNRIIETISAFSNTKGGTIGRPYKRVGKSTLKVSKDEYERLILEKHKDRSQFDTQIYLRIINFEKR